MEILSCPAATHVAGEAFGNTSGSLMFFNCFDSCFVESAFRFVGLKFY